MNNMHINHTSHIVLSHHITNNAQHHHTTNNVQNHDTINNLQYQHRMSHVHNSNILEIYDGRYKVLLFATHGSFYIVS